MVHQGHPRFPTAGGTSSELFSVRLMVGSGPRGSSRSTGWSGSSGCSVSPKSLPLGVLGDPFEADVAVEGGTDAPGVLGVE